MEKTKVTCSFGNDDYGLQTGNVKISDLHDFKGHPFKVEQDIQLFELMRSIEDKGVLVPLIVRSKRGKLSFKDEIKTYVRLVMNYECTKTVQDVVEMLSNLHRNREPLLHCAVFVEMKARNLEALKELQSDIAMEFTRSKLTFDKLTLRQKEGFYSVMPLGVNMFGAQYERVLPASSAADLYPFNFSGKTDPHGLYIGRDKYGSNIIVDFNKRAEDKTNSNILILGNSGQGKSYLLKLLLINFLESGKSICCLDPEHEYEDLCNNFSTGKGGGASCYGCCAGAGE